MTSALTESESKNFATLQRAWDGDDVALVRSKLLVDIPAGTEVALVAAMGWDAETEEFLVTPFAMMMPGNPYEMLEDPTQEEE